MALPRLPLYPLSSYTSILDIVSLPSRLYYLHFSRAIIILNTSVPFYMCRRCSYPSALLVTWCIRTHVPSQSLWTAFLVSVVLYNLHPLYQGPTVLHAYLSLPIDHAILQLLPSLAHHLAYSRCSFNACLVSDSVS